ncbi:hypothetical protein JQ604_19505 [Bradyrhizobium jicamae]|uniref:hypothetical protein n=1 Tax=Bradyrhizobium jicamae TaxID=280332 RepID=UPI001BADDF4A|nr:hypothetical protein [Bradyrhizobium jicamae]MBR0754375.1 hypothetical protein [Bradyrhizobium jicamae]
MTSLTVALHELEDDGWRNSRTSGNRKSSEMGRPTKLVRRTTVLIAFRALQFSCETTSDPNVSSTIRGGTHPFRTVHKMRTLLIALILCLAANSPARVAAQAFTSSISPVAQAADPLAGGVLYDDVKRYEAFGPHRFGTVGANAALDWMADRLRAAGLDVEMQQFSMERQYILESATMMVDGKTTSILPQWWIPEDKSSFELSAPIAGDGDAEGKFVRLTIPYDQGAYLNKKHRERIAAALSRKPAAILLTMDHPSGEIFTYNVSQTDAAWTVPVLLVAPKDEHLLEEAERAGSTVTVAVRGRYERNVPGRNVIGRLDRGKDVTIVVSTPVTSWFTSTCERGPGIAAFLATASFAARSLPDANFVFVATAGHEIGHGGMEFFLSQKAPRPNAKITWVHYGASLACYRRSRDGDHWKIAPEVDAQSRFFGVSDALAATAQNHFHNVQATWLVGDRAAAGELRDIKGMGYSNFLGMFGLHPLFHTPLDNSEMTGPAVLEPVVRGFAAALQDIIDKQKALRAD